MRMQPAANGLTLNGACDGEPYATLSPQELSCLLGIWDGLTVKGVAARLGLSEKTVKNYLSNTYHKLGVDNGQVPAVRRALELGILQMPARARPREWDIEVPGEVSG